MTTINNKKSFTRKSFLDNKRPIYIVPSSTSSTFQNLKDSMVSGLGAGVGMSVADRLVSTVLGPRKVEVQTENKIVRSPDCEDISKIYREALVKDIYISQTLKEAYEKCNQAGNSSHS
jgi:hypothetical protein